MRNHNQSKYEHISLSHCNKLCSFYQINNVSIKSVSYMLNLISWNKIFFLNETFCYMNVYCATWDMIYYVYNLDEACLKLYIITKIIDKYMNTHVPSWSMTCIHGPNSLSCQFHSTLSNDKCQPAINFFIVFSYTQNVRNDNILLVTLLRKKDIAKRVWQMFLWVTVIKNAQKKTLFPHAGSYTCIMNKISSITWIFGI
jgi:hypothetical protein